jgi:predicted TIM-barrel fold metal-dependent hydrolase
MIEPAKAIEGLDALGLDMETTALFLGQNAQRVFHLTT